MNRASGIGHLRPFLPGLEAVLEDPDVSEIMINGPRNVRVERRGELEPVDAPVLSPAANRWLTAPVGGRHDDERQGRE